MRSIISFSESLSSYGGYYTKLVALIIGMVLSLLCLSHLVGQEPLHFGSFEVISGYGGNVILDRSHEQERCERQRFEQDQQALSENMAPLEEQGH